MSIRSWAEPTVKGLRFAFDPDMLRFFMGRFEEV